MTDTPTPVMADSFTRRAEIRRKAVEGLMQSFPLKARSYSVELSNPLVEEREFSSREQKQAILEGRSLNERVRGDITVRDAQGNVTSTAKGFTLLHLPYFTPRHTFIVDGTEYSVSNQIRTKSGVYTRRRGNEDLEAAFNLSKGGNFRVLMEPEKGHLFVQPTHSTTRIPLYPVLRALGVPHQDIAGHWGGEVASLNRDAFKNPEKHVEKFYANFIHPAQQTHASLEEKIRALHGYLDTTAMDPHVNQATLGHGYDKASPQAILAASKKLLDVHRAADDTDDRDSLAFKTFHSVDDFIKERLALDARSLRMKLGIKLEAHKGDVRKALPSAPFTRSVNSFLTGSSLSAVPTQINPMELIDHAVRVTSLGEGAISSERAIPLEARNLHATHFGIMDPVRTPECADPLTEVLTSSGWKFWPDVTDDDRLACRINGELQFKKPTNLTAKHYEGLMYGVNTGKISYLVTPNHRVWCRPVGYTTGYGKYKKPGQAVWRIDRADEVHEKPREFDTGHAPYKGKAVASFTLPKVRGTNQTQIASINMVDWAAFMGWYLSEGCVTQRTGRVKYSVQLSQKTAVNPENCARIEALLRRLPFRWTKLRSGTGYMINSTQLATYLSRFGLCDKKYIPAYLFDTSVETRETLLDALMRGDGRIDCTRATGKTYKQSVYCTTSARLAADVDRLAVSLGRPTKTARYRDLREKRYLDVYEVRLVRGLLRQAFKKPKKNNYYTLKYDGMVYCAEVPGGLLYMRRDGQLPLWTGNSFKAGIDIRAALSTRRDAQGNLFSTLRNLKTGRTEHVKAEDIMRSVVAFPHEDVRPGKMVDALTHGHVQRVPASQVTHQVVHVSDLYGPTTNLLPFLDGMQGNRSLMASKHQSQALSLIHREAPLVQVNSWNPDMTVEREMVKLIVPTSPVAGVVSHIDDDYIHITPDQAKHGSAAFPEGYETSTRADDEHPGGTVVDVHHKEKNVAWLSYQPKGDHTHIESMYVAPDHRGKGLAHSLLKETIAANPGELRLRARPFKDESTSTDALKKLYQRHGFVSSDNEGRMTRHKTAADDEFYSDFMKLSDNGTIKLHYDQNFPLAAKTYLHNELKVKAGDRVTAGQLLASSNFTKDDTLALGTNLSVAYMPYRGLNTNDGIVVSEGAARRLTSEHMYKHMMLLAGDVETKKEKHRAYFGNKYTAKQYDNLDEEGVVRPGAEVQPHDPLIVAVRPNQMTGNSVLLGRLSKTLVKPFSEEVETWSHDRPGKVIDVSKTGDRITVTVKTEETINIGDKLSGRYGNKGVIAKIVPDHQMVQDEKGRPIDLLFTSAGIISRINPAQVIEASLGKVAAHIGKPIAVDNYAPHDNVQYAKDLLKKHGLSDKETIFDPVTNKHIPKVFVGKSYILKLFKTTDSNWSSHGADRYDFNQQPARGGDDGAKAIGKMEFDGLVAHNARNVLKESASLKSQKNDEFWRAIQLGLPTPTPQTPFAYNKFLTMLEGAGVKVSKKGSRLSLGPLTDNDITKMSSGVLKEPHKMIRAKDLQPETGGMFDPATTGGMSGTKWTHVDLHEPLVNPVFEEPVRRLLGLTQKEFNELHDKHGGAWFRQELSRINVDERLKELRDRSRNIKGSALDDVVKQIKYLNSLQAHNLSPDLAYVLTKIPVTPPMIRPILPLKDGRLQVGDANLLYRDAFLANQKLHEVKGVLPSNELQAPRKHLYDAVSAVFGVGDPVSPTTEKREAKGYLAMITGTRPGSGFFQGKLMKRQQDVSGRATIAPDPTLSMDEIGVPEDMLWGMYGKFVIGRLVKRGYPALDAQKMVEDKNPLARQELLAESKERPVMVNRAPSLHRFNIIGAYPKMTSGKTLMLNPFAEKGTNADYDGDAMQIHAPVTQAAVEDVKRMTLSHLLFNDRRPGQLNVAPDMEAIIGLHRATGVKSDKATKFFSSKEEALGAYHRGDVSLSDTVEIAK